MNTSAVYAGKKLPIVLDTAIISECWTFAKLAVIQTSKYAEAWLASHLTLHRTSWLTYFGDCHSYHDLAYYEDILTIREMDIFSLDGDRLVEALKQNVDRESYSLIYTDWNISGEGEPRFHEILIYGYNDEKQVFYAPILSGRRFKEAEFPYAHIQKSLPLFLEHVKSGNKSRLWTSLKYQLLFFTISLKKEYSPDFCAYAAFKKIMEEANGRQICGVSLEDNWAPVFEERKYSGIACLHSMRLALNYLFQRGSLPDRCEKLTLSFKKIHEHRALLLLSMKYIVKTWAIDAPEILELIDTYQHCCDRTEGWYLTALKYETVQNPALPKQIADDLPIAYKEERETLQSFVSACEAWYAGHCETI